MFRKKILLLLSFLIYLSPLWGFNYNTAEVKFVLDPANLTLNLPISLPNDLNITIINPETHSLSIPIMPNDALPIQLLKTAINSLDLKGLPPNTFLNLPLNSDVKINLESIYSHLFIVPIKLNLSSNPVPDVNFLEHLIYGPQMLYIFQDGNDLKVIFKKRLIPDAQYAVFLFKDVVTIDGKKVGHDPAMELLMKTEYKPLLDAFYLNEDQILYLTTFSTAGKNLKLSAYLKLKNGIPYDGNDILNYSSINEEFQELLYATNILPSPVSSNVIGNLYGINYFKNNFTSYDITTLTTNPSPIQVPTLIIPNGVKDKVIIYQHGLGMNKESAFAIAQKFLPAGYPIIAMDLPQHGERAKFDCNGDGIVSSGECYFTTDLMADRINIYQSVFDLTMLLKDLKSGKFDIDGDGKGDPVNKVYYIGISLGSITGSIFAEYNIDNLEKVALSVGGADLASLLDGTHIPSLEKAIELLGLTKNTGEYSVFLGMLHFVLDPADPLYNVDSKIKDKVLIQTAYGDIIVPNSSNAVLAAQAGYPMPVVLTDFNNEYISNPSPGWYQFGGIKDGIPYIVPHAFLVKTEGASEYYGLPFDQEFIDSAKEAAQTQILNFFNEN